MAQNNRGFLRFITSPIWQSLAAIAAIIGLFFAFFVWFVPNYNSLFGQSTSITPTPSIFFTQTVGITTNSNPTAVPTVDPMSASSLIPNFPAILTDSLDNPNDPNQWAIGLNGTTTCSFDSGALHMLAPANTGGGECNTQAANTNFTNFVYQIKMTILKGLNQQGGVGPSFCVSSLLNGSWYRVSFELGGYWTFGYLTGGMGGVVHDHTLTSGVSKAFHQGIGQSNYITMRVENHEIDVQVNGQQLFPSITNSQLDGGMIGVQLGPGSQDADVAFSDMKVWQL